MTLHLALLALAVVAMLVGWAAGYREQRAGGAERWVLYVPAKNGRWSARAFESAREAAVWLAQKHPPWEDEG